MHTLKRWRRRHLGVAVLLSAAASAVLLFAAGATAATTTLYDQNDNFDSWAYGVFDPLGVAQADDFVVPAGESWHITSVFAPGGDAGNVSMVTVNIYHDSAGAPGTLAYSTTADAGSFTDDPDPYWVTSGYGRTHGDLTVPLDVTLPAGHYWLSVLPNSQWWWNVRDVVSSSPAMMIDGSGINFSGTGCTSWSDLAGCYGDYSTGSLDLMFTLSGEIIQPVTIGQLGTASSNYEGCGVYGGVWQVQASVSSGTVYKVPAGNWVITSWSTNVPSFWAGGYQGLMVFRPNASQYEVVGESALVQLSAGLNTTTLPAGTQISVQGGDLLGLWATNAPCAVLDTSWSTTSDYVALAPGGTQPAAGDTVTPTAAVGQERLNISATLTPAVVDETPPLVSSVVASPNPVAPNTGSTLTATVDDSTTGGSDISSAEYNIDGGGWVSMAAADGSFDSPTEDVTATLPGQSTPGDHTICVRGSDTAGNTSGDESNCIEFDVYAPQASAEELIASLQTEIADLGLKKGIVSALNGPLKEAAAALAEGNTDDAIGAMNDFLDYVNAQTGKKLSTEQVDMLTSAAEDILDTLTSSD